MRTAVALVIVAACGGGTPAPRSDAAADPAAPASVPAPKLVVLGVAQDAGVPQAACASPACEQARRDPAYRQRAASVAIASRDGSVALVDATPDLREQLDDAIAIGQSIAGSLGKTLEPRRPVSAVLLTHAHMGHYLGLAHFGFEAAHTDAVPVYATSRMAAFLRDNAPWDQLVRLRNIELFEITAGEAFELPGVRVVPIAVPHRGEYTDTVAFRFEGPSATALYLPDTDPWSAHVDPLAPFHGVDVALVDATFFSGDELPGRDLAEIGHPTVRSTLELLGDRVANGSLRVVLVHLNHSNPLLDPTSAASAEVRAAGFEVAAQGMEITL